MTTQPPYSLPLEAAHWGSLLSEHLPVKNRLKAAYAMSALLLPFALCCFGLGFALPPRQQTTGFVFGSFLGIVLVAMMAILVIHARRSSNRSIRVYPEGLIFITLGGNGESDVFAWEQIESVRQQIVRGAVNGVPVGTTHNYILRRNDGKEIRFDDFVTNAETLGATIQRETFPFLMRRVRAAFDTGQTVSFGKLHVSQSGLSDGNETLPWKEVEEVKVAEGVIHVRKHGQWLRWSHAPISETPNVFVFLALCHAEQGV